MSKQQSLTCTYTYMVVLEQAPSTSTSRVECLTKQQALQLIATNIMLEHADLRTIDFNDIRQTTP